MKYIINDDVVLSRPLEGPLAGQIAAFAKWARDQGYALESQSRRVLLAETFRDQLCRTDRCPAYVAFTEHSHISTGMSANTSDDSVTGPLLTWMKSIR